MNNYFIVPGIGNSGPEHWQTYFENSAPNFIRILQKEWNSPDCSDWTSTIEKTISAYDPASVILVAHSLGCMGVVQWAKCYNKTIKAALLVAPSDPEAPQYTFPTTGFTPIPLEKINFKTVIVASTNDQWISLDRAKQFAKSWGSELINIGDAGHINVSSGHGQWKQGLEILKMLD